MVGLGQGAQIGNFGRDGPDKYFLLGDQKKIGRFGQGAQIGNFAGDGPGKYFLEDQKKNGRTGAGRPDWEFCLGGT